MSDRYTVRVELFETNDGTSEEYEILHAEMEAKGFKRTIMATDGTEYHLPPAEYNIIDVDTTPEKIREDASKAAAKTGKEYSVLVTPSSCRHWKGLKPVKKKVYTS